MGGVMRKILIVTVLYFCFSSSMVLADVSLFNAGNTAITTMSLDSNTADCGPIGAIINAISKLDAWIQNNLW